MIFDGCVWVALAAGQVDRQAIISVAGDAPIYTSVISLGELSFGVEACVDPAERAVRAAYLRQTESRPNLEVAKHAAAVNRGFAVMTVPLRRARRALFTCIVGALLLSSPGAWADAPYRAGPASPDGIGKFYDGREIAQVMGFEGAGWLERPTREAEERTDWLVEALRLKPGMTVADIGAGSGYLSRRIAPRVAPGKVFAVDVQPQMIALLEKVAAQPGMGNVVPVLGAADDVKLAAATVDLAIMVDVYHELEYPYEVMQSLVRAVKPDGEIVFVEYRGEDPNVPIKALHKMSETQVKREMRRFPLVLERTSERLPLQHILVFRKR